MIKLNRS